MLSKKYDSKLVLEDGRVFRGRRFGAKVTAAGEVVFNTAMSGYQEILTDPSYAGQLVVMTSTQIGNYGVATDDEESRQLFLGALIVRELSRIASNWRAVATLDEYLSGHGVPGLEGLDTRALVRHLRDRGAMRGVIASLDTPTEELIVRAREHPSMAGCDLATGVTRNQTYAWEQSPGVANLTDEQAAAPEKNGSRQFHVVVYDYGVKWNILRCLVEQGCRVTVVPATASAQDVMKLEPDGVMLSNGPGDPDPLDYAVDNIRDLLGRVPIGGICLGHQLLAIAVGGKTFKLKFGHRGSNHPVIDRPSGRVQITSHNHGFAVDPDSLPADSVEITHLNLNDHTVEGLALRKFPGIAVQFHPEASPGPHDAHSFFPRFVELMNQWRMKQTHAGAK